MKKRMRTACVGLAMVAWACLVWLPGPVWAQGVSLDAVERTGPGEINWTTGWVKATGLGAPPEKASSPGQARAMAQRAAYAVAVRNLLEAVKGVRVDSATLVENYIVTSDVIKTQVSGFVRGAQVVKTDVQSDGGVEVTVRVPLWGADSLFNAFTAEMGLQSKDLPPDSQNGEGATGLVIDARGLGVKPACFPSVVDDKGQVVYGPELVDKAEAEKNGMVQYRTLPKDAKISSLFGNDAYVIQPVQLSPMPREGRRPLKIKGADKAGSLKANIMISSEDAQKIRGDGQMKGALGRSRVVIVTDPLIGGMEGRAPGSSPEAERLLAALPGESR
nr:LPP20 family lipoprotein [Nitrospirota bacterium]